MEPKKQIVRIESQRRRPDRKTIFFDDGSVFGIPGDVFLSENLHVGDELDAGRINDLLEESDRQKLWDRALNLLSFRARSWGELKQRLEEKGYAAAEIIPILDSLTEKGYLNDLEFARLFARDKIKFKYLGPIALRSELMKKYVDQRIIDQVIDEEYSRIGCAELIAALIKKKKVITGQKLEEKARKSLVDYLARKGYQWNDIQTELHRQGLL